MPTTAPPRAPIPDEPAAQPTRTPMPMQATSTARSSPPAPAALNCDGEAACISRARIPEVGASLVTHRTGVVMRFLPKFVRPSRAYLRDPPRRGDPLGLL